MGDDINSNSRHRQRVRPLQRMTAETIAKTSIDKQIRRVGEAAVRYMVEQVMFEHHRVATSMAPTMTGRRHMMQLLLNHRSHLQILHLLGQEPFML